jgi:hypothetical protein
MGAKDYYVAIKAEPVAIGVPDVTVTGAKKMRLNAMTTPHLAQATIQSREIRADRLTSMPRLGTQAGDVTFPSDLRFGEPDAYLEAALGGAFATDILVPGLTRRSYTAETYEQDIDTSVLSKGLRFGGFHLAGAPDEPALLEFPAMFIKQEVLASGASPFYTTPTVGSTEMMVATDAAIEVDDVPVLDLTSFDFTIVNGLSLAKVVGSPFSPDVYEGNFAVTGSISALRSSAARQSAYLAGTPFKFVVTFSDPAGNIMIFRFPNLLAADFSLPLGSDGPPVATIPVMGGVVGTDAMIEIERTAAV